MATRDNPYKPPLNPDSKGVAARSHLLCIEQILLNIKSINNAQTMEVELQASIVSIETFLSKAKSLLKQL